jgi:hypothetical protein
MIAYSDAVSRALTVLYENEGAAMAIEQMKEERGVTVAEAAGGITGRVRKCSCANRKAGQQYS